MAGTRGFRRAVALMAAIGAAVAGAMAGTASHASEGDPVISWPSATKLNPTTMSYELTTSYGGPDYILLVVSAPSIFETQPVAPNGTTEVSFPPGWDGELALMAVLCPTESYSGASCRAIDVAHRVTVRDEYLPQLSAADRLGPSTPLAAELVPAEGDSVDVTWEVVKASASDDPPLAQGTVNDLPLRGISGGHVALPPIGPTQTLEYQQRYVYRAMFAGEAGPFGPLSGAASVEFTWDDRVGATDIRLDVYDEFLDAAVRDVDVFYPSGDYHDYGDSWRDSLSIDLEPRQHEAFPDFAITITDETGAVVEESAKPHLDVTWWGRDARHDLLPEGTYTVSVRLGDRAGNHATLERQVRLSHESLILRRWRRTVSAKASMVGRSVGRCGSIRMPARAGWRGSVGLRSSNAGRRCRTIQAQSVSTFHGINLPRSPFGRYDRYEDIRVSTYGGGPSAGASYLVQWYWSRNREWVGRSEFGRSLALHAGRRQGSAVVHGDPDEGPPSVIWAVGLAEGAKYDVKSFTVRASFYDVGYR